MHIHGLFPVDWKDGKVCHDDLHNLPVDLLLEVSSWFSKNLKQMKPCQKAIYAIVSWSVHDDIYLSRWFSTAGNKKEKNSLVAEDPRVDDKHLEVSRKGNLTRDAPIFTLYGAWINCLGRLYPVPESEPLTVTNGQYQKLSD